MEHLSEFSARVIIIIVGYNCRDDVVQCLNSISRLSYNDFEVVIIENHSAAAAHDLYSCFRDAATFSEVEDVPSSTRVRLYASWVFGENKVPVALYLARSNLGYAGAVNEALEVCRSKNWFAAWIVNPDVTADQDCLVNLIERARMGGGLVAGKIVLRSSGRIQMYGGKWRKMIARGLNIGEGDHVDTILDTPAIEDKIDFVSGASLFVTRDFVVSTGPMCEDYFLYCEEVDWCLRRGSHKILFADKAIVYHGHGSTIGSSSYHRERSLLSVYLDERNKILLTRRFYPRTAPVVAIIALLVSFQYLKKSAFRQWVAAIQGWFAGIQGETGLPPNFSKLAARMARAGESK